MGFVNDPRHRAHCTALRRFWSVHSTENDDDDDDDDGTERAEGGEGSDGSILRIQKPSLHLFTPLKRLLLKLCMQNRAVPKNLCMMLE